MIADRRHHRPTVCRGHQPPRAGTFAELVRLAAVDKVRRRVQREHTGHRARRGGALYGVRRLPRRRADHLTERARPVDPEHFLSEEAHVRLPGGRGPLDGSYGLASGTRSAQGRTTVGSHRRTPGGRVRETVDLLVVGGGTAGIVAAKTAGRLGADVLLAERDRTGGDCLWTGCVPSKALLAAAATAQRMRTADRFGIAAVRPEVDFTAVREHVRRAIGTIEPVDSPEALRSAGARVRIGAAVFTGEDTAEVAGEPVRFRHAVLATGSEPALPEIPGLAEADPLTSDSVWQLSELPRSMVVLGGGPVGCELGQAFARLGTEVTIVEAEGRLLPREEPAAGAALTEALRGEGIQVCTGVPARRAGPGTLEVAGTGKT
ncbi:MAG: FAD-dependent oxidoreductase, partial [Sciscionella sp.]